MKTNVSSYWLDCIEAAFDAAGIVATPEQMANVASDVEMSHDMYGQAHGYDCIPDPLQLENDRLRKQLKLEQSKIICPTCKGKGRLYHQGPYHSSDSQCDDCRGEGYRVP